MAENAARVNISVVYFFRIIQKNSSFFSFYQQKVESANPSLEKIVVIGYLN